jgi:hypothetical protein
MKKILLFCIAAILLITTVNAAITPNWTPYFDVTTGDEIHYNQSSTLDNSGSTPWEMWWASGLIGLVLFLLSLRPRTSAMELEVDAIIGSISIVPILFCGWASFNIDRITGYGVTGLSELETASGITISHEFVMMINHTIYNFPVIGILMFIFAGVAVFNVIRILAQHKLFRIRDQEEEMMRNKPKFGTPPQSNEPDKPQ